MYNVMIVDDEPFIIEGLYDIIDWSELGLTIVGHAENGRKALELLRTVPADILISDISMPEMNGLDLIREARALRPELMAVILSGYNEFDYVKEGMTLGVENYLLKPVNVEELEETMANAVRKLNATRRERALAAFDIRIIRDNVLYRWLTGQIAPREMEERTELLQLDLGKPYVLAALIRAEPDAPVGDAGTQPARRTANRALPGGQAPDAAVAGAPPGAPGESPGAASAAAASMPPGATDAASAGAGAPVGDAGTQPARRTADRALPAGQAPDAAMAGAPAATPSAASAGAGAAASTADLLEAALAAEPSVIVFREIGGAVAAVFTMTEPSAGRAAAEAALLRLKRLAPQPARVRISLGTVERVADASASYANAKRAQEYAFLHPERELLDYGELTSRRDGGAQPPVDWSQYARWIVAREREPLLARIGDDFARLRESGGMTPQDAQTLAYELLIRFKIELEEIKHTDEYELFRACFERVGRAETASALADAVKEAAALALDTLARDVKSPVIQQVLNHVHAHYAEPLSLKGLGADFNIHPVYLGQLFQKETHQTFTAYLNGYRIERAKELLKDNRLRVQDIAQTVGYWETGYFYKQFKKYVGVSPSDYKGLL